MSKKPSRTRKAQEPEGAAPITAPEGDMQAEVARLRKQVEAAVAAKEAAEAVAEQMRKAREAAVAAKEALETKIEQERKEREEVNAAEFFQLPLQDTITNFLHPAFLDYPSLPPANPPKKARSSPRGTSIDGRAFPHYFPCKVQTWDDLEGEMAALLTKTKEIIVRRPIEPPVKKTVFDHEKIFGQYWVLPREAVLEVLTELYPESPLVNVRFNTASIGPTRPDELVCVFARQFPGYDPKSIVAMEHGYPGVHFFVDLSVADLCAAGEPAKGDQKLEKREVICTLAQTFTYQLDNLCKYGCFTNWDWWIFTKRVISNGEEILYVSPWMGKDRARLAYSTVFNLAASDLDAEELKQKGKTCDAPEWVRGKISEEEENPLHPSVLDPPAAEQTGGAGARSAYPSTTTKLAMGVQSLTMLDEFEVLGDSEKSQTRRIKVNGQDVVAKLVDFLGVPRHSEYSARNLYNLEWNEVSIYHYLREVQGRLVPRFLYHGMDFNSIWATAVTEYAGQSLCDVDLTPEIRAAAVASLRELHALGVMHNDMALRNAVWNGQRVMWVDFELSYLREEDPAHFDADAEKEVEDLLELLGPEPAPIVAAPEPAPLLASPEPETDKSPGPKRMKS